MVKLARMHTAEHLLSAVMRLHYNAPRNVELHLNEKKTKCDYDLACALDAGQVEIIQLLVNNEIQRDHTVTDFYLPRTDAAERYDLWKVPENSDRIRIVKIGELDEQPCGGQHVSHTREIGHFHIVSHEMKANCRVRFRFRVS